MSDEYEDGYRDGKRDVDDEMLIKIASLREQLSNMMAVVASVERERDHFAAALEKCSEQLTRLGYSANHADEALTKIRGNEMNLDTLEKMADAAIVEVEPGIYYSRPEAYDEYLDHCSPQTIKSLIALCKQLNVLIYDAIESGDDDPLREALAAYERFNKGE